MGRGDTSSSAWWNARRNSSSWSMSGCTSSGSPPAPARRGGVMKTC